MRIQKIRTYYGTYLLDFYARHPQFVMLGYEAQHAALMADSFGASDFWSNALRKLGYETNESIANVEQMQRRWAREHDATTFDSEVRSADALLDITRRQIKAFRPTVLFVADYAAFNRDFLRQVKNENPTIKLVVGWCGAPYTDGSVFHEYDIVLSCVPELVAHFRRQGHAAFHLNHAFAPQVLERIETTRPPHTDFSFIGSIIKRHRFHNERERLLKALVRKIDLKIYAEVHEPEGGGARAGLGRVAFDVVRAARGAGISESLLAAMPVVNRAARWQTRPDVPQRLDAVLRRRVRPPLFGLRMYQALRDSRVSLNTHIDISPVSASNMRLFEATGTGSCLLTDDRANIAELFTPDAEVVTYRNADECAERAKYLLEHEAERAAIARAGQRRTLRDHTYDTWARGFDEIIRAAM